MLKIWLTCLQPSLSILGMVLVLSNTISAHAASKTTGVLPNKVFKGQSQQKTAKPLAQPPQFGAKRAAIVTASTSPQGVRVSSYGSSASPDDAVRRLALDTIAKSDRKVPNLATKTSQQNNSGLASFISPSPSRFSSIASKPTNGKFVRHSVTTATRPQTAPANPVVPELFIGNSNTNTFDRPMENFPNLATPSSQTTSPVVAQSFEDFPNLATPSSQQISPVVAQSLPTATMTASTRVVEPVPVMEPARIKPVESTVVPVVVTQTAPQSNPLATNVSKGLEQFMGNEPKRIPTDVASSPTLAKGLEQLVANEPKSIQVDIMAPVAKAIPSEIDSTPALSELVSPAKATPRTANGSSLQLATSKAYDSAADFDLPEMNTQLRATARAKVKVPAVKPDRSTVVVNPKNDSVALVSNQPLKSQQSWMSMRQGNSLGGLILGTRSSIDNAQASTNEIAALPINIIKASSANGLGLLDPIDQY